MPPVLKSIFIFRALTPTLGKKCLKKKSPEFVYALGARSISVHDLKCGVRNITNEYSISWSDICWSNTEDKLGKYTLFRNR